MSPALPRPWAVVFVGVIVTAGCRTSGDGAAQAPPLGRVACWGLGVSGQIGVRDRRDVYGPTPVAGVDDATRLMLGASMSCAQVGTGIRCWGELGPGDGGPQVRAFELVPDAIDVQTSTRFGCALRRGGEVACWGSNLLGQLGNGAAPADTEVVLAVDTATGEVDLSAARDVIAAGTERAPVAVTGLDDATAIAIGGGHACALRRAGTVVCWGAGSAGELGDGRIGPSESSDHPVAVAGLSGVVEVAAGGRATCARTAEGVWCWGTLEDGYGRRHAWPRPTRIEGVTSPVELAVAELSACARGATGHVACWKDDGKIEPVDVDDAVQLAAGQKHVCARLGSGAVRCWGDDSREQRGPRDETTGNVRGVAGVVDVAAGAMHTCVIRAADAPPAAAGS